MFEHFTERARKVMSIARNEAQRSGAESITGEHILLGMTLDRGNPCARMLESVGVTADVVRASLSRTAPTQDVDASTRRQLPFSARLERMFERLDMSRRHELIDSPDVLLALLKESAHVLIGLGVDPVLVRRKLLTPLEEMAANAVAAESKDPAEACATVDMHSEPGSPPGARTRPGAEPQAGSLAPAMQLAMMTARRLGSAAVGGEHLVLALLLDEASPIVNALKARSIDVDGICRGIDALMKGPVSSEARLLPMAPSVSALFQAARKGARILGQDFDARHILLGMTTLGTVSQIIRGLGGDPEAVDRTLREFLDGRTSRLERLTDRARMAAAFARSIAARGQAQAIGPEHLLLGVVQIRGGGAERVMAHLQATPEAIQASIEVRLATTTSSAPASPGAQRTDSESLLFTDEADRVFARACELASEFQQSAVCTEHLLLAIVETGGDVTRHLEALGLTVERTRQAVEATLDAGDRE